MCFLYFKPIKRWPSATDIESCYLFYIGSWLADGYGVSCIWNHRSSYCQISNIRFTKSQNLNGLWQRKTTARPDEKYLSFGIGAAYIRGLTVGVRWNKQDKHRFTLIPPYYFVQKWSVFLIYKTDKYTQTYSNRGVKCSKRKYGG